jgi:thiamine pyrophosphate-dependent acetolactate synthase large subunit-like protein
MMMALYSFEQASLRNLPIIYIILNNSSLGNVRDYLTTKGRKVMEYHEINFTKIAESMGVKGVKAVDFVEFETAFKEALDRDGPTVIDMIVKRADHNRLTTT